MRLTWLKRILIPIFLLGAISLSGCNDASFVTESASPWPKMAKIEPIVLTPQEVEMVKRWDKESGGLVSALKKTLDAYKAEADTYERARKAHNKKVIEGVAKALNWTPQQIKEALANEE